MGKNLHFTSSNLQRNLPKVWRTQWRTQQIFTVASWDNNYINFYSFSLEG